MKLSDFFGSGRGSKLRTIASLPFSGGRLAVRPLTFEEFVLLDAGLGGYRPAAAAMMSGRHPGVDIKDAIRLAFAILFPDEPAERLDAASAEEVGAVFAVIASSHDWKSIGARMGSGETAATPEATLRLFWLIEQKTGRRIESVLSMKIEAALALVDLVCADAEIEASSGPRPVRTTGDDLSVLDSLPGLEISRAH